MPPLRDPRVVKIFFSSPFGGMEEEREELTRRYFPSIHSLCNSKGLQFAAVDMRWGITSESSDNAQVINICLRELDRSDMFIGFFGQRYGWHGAEDKILQENFNNAVGRYPWLNDYRDKSVTELEFLHGFLNNPGNLPAAIFFRDKSFDDKRREEGEKMGDKKTVFKYSAESELAVKLMNELKERVGEQKQKSLGVYMDYKTPAEAAKIMYETIMRHLNEVLLKDFHLTVDKRPDELLNQHNAFLASRCNIYVHGDAYLPLLNKQLMTENRQHVVVTGAPGCGKSALLCNWINSLKEADKSSYSLVYHFVGFADSSTDVRSILSRLVKELELKTSSMVDGSDKIDLSSSETAATDDIRQLMQRLVAAMNKAVSLGKTPVLVIDGLDKITSSSKINKVLFWLPTSMPRSCLVILSTVDRDNATIEELIGRQFTAIHIEPLPDTHKREMCVKTLQESGKELSSHQLDRIVATEMTQSPLFLKVVLSELVSFGYFRLLDKKIDSLVASTSIEELLLKVLERLSEDYNVEEYEGALVEQVLSVIMLSRQGLSEAEIKEMFSIPDHVWSPFYFAIEKLVINQAGKIKFAFMELEEATRKAYCEEEFKKNKYLRTMIDFFQAKLTTNVYPASPSTSNHSVFELPWLWLQLGDLDGLADCLSNFTIFSEWQKNFIYDLVSLWRETALPSSKIVDKLLDSFDRRVAEIYTDLEERCLLSTSEAPGLKIEAYLAQIDNFLRESGYHDNREKVILRRIRVLNEGLKHGVVKNMTSVKQELFESNYKLACVYCQLLNHTEEGIALHKQLMNDIQTSEELKTIMNVQSTLGNSHHGIAVGYMYLRQYDEVIECCLEALEHCERGKSDFMLKEKCVTWINLGLAYMYTGQLDLALQYNDKCIEAYEEIYFGELPPEVGEVLTNKGLVLRRLDRMDEAEQTYKRSLQVKLNALGHDHTSVASSYINLCSLEMYRQNKTAAMEYCQEALDIFERLGQTWDETNYVNALENKMACQTDLEQYSEADDTFQKVLKWRVKERNMDWCMPTLYQEMGKYYLREGMFGKAYHTMHALLDSKHSTTPINYILMDYALASLPKEYTEKLPVSMSLVSAVDKYPEDVSLVKRLVEDHLVPAGDCDEVARLINRLHDNSDMADQVYKLTGDWCKQGETVQEECIQRIIEEGLIKYPGDKELLLELAKTYCRKGAFRQALDLLIPIVEDAMDNFPLVHMAADMAVRAGDTETCKKYCQVIVDKCQDEDMVQRVKQLLGIIEESEEEDRIEKEKLEENEQGEKDGEK